MVSVSITTIIPLAFYAHTTWHSAWHWQVLRKCALTLTLSCKLKDLGSNLSPTTRVSYTWKSPSPFGPPFLQLLERTGVFVTSSLLPLEISCDFKSIFHLENLGFTLKPFCIHHFKDWKQPNWWMNRQSVVHPCNGLLLSNVKEQTTDTRMTWLNLKCMMLREISQTQKTTDCIIPFS